jgi:hypothetical protein
MLERFDCVPLFFAPFVSSVMRIEPHWIDYNGHLNMAYYNVQMPRLGPAVTSAWRGSRSPRHARATAGGASIPEFSGLWGHPYWPGFEPPALCV